MESWRDPDVVRFTNIVVPAVLAGERQIAQLTNTHLTTARNLTLGTNDRPSPLDLRAVTGDALRNGVSPAEVYRRPQSTLNLALSKGRTVTDAVDLSMKRLKKITEIDLQLAKTNTVALQGTSTFRRVLTGAENCSMCVIASTQRYRRGNLMPIHGGCDCGIEEIHGGDANHVVAPATLEEIHAAIDAQYGGTDRGARLLDGRNDRSDFLDLIVTREHGETGPTLAWRDQHFTSAAALA